jgi:hypothetical protein
MGEDNTEIAYYTERVKRMGGKVLSDNGITRHETGCVSLRTATNSATRRHYRRTTSADQQIFNRQDQSRQRLITDHKNLLNIKIKVLMRDDITEPPWRPSSRHGG